MQTEYFVTLIRHRGKLVKSALRHVSARGSLTVAEIPCDVQKRPVLTATLTRVDGGEPLPPLRDAVLRAAKSSGVLTISGVEERVDGPLGDVEVFAQSWKLVPAAFEELERAERDLGRLVFRLATLGVEVSMRPGGGMVIPGETRADDGAPV